MSDTAPAACAADEEFTAAGPIGRLARLAVGTMQLYYVGAILTQIEFVKNSSPPRGVGFWIFVVSAFGLLSWTVNLAFLRKWASRPFVVAMVVVLGAAGFDLFYYGSMWAPPLTMVIVAVTLYVHGHMGLCHVLAGLIATRGCEMRAIPHLIAMLRGRGAQFQVCPGFWRPLDEWESNWKRRGAGEPSRG